MADANTEIDLDEIHQAIIDAIEDQFPDLKTVADYYEDRKKIPLPACFIELTELTQADMDPGTDQLALLSRWEARVIIGFRTQNAKRNVRKLVTALAAFIRTQRWGKPIGSAEVIGCYPDEFNPGLDQYEVWRVEWTQVIHFGASVWTNDGTLPTSVEVAFSPNTGETEDYSPVVEPEEEPEADDEP
ncbi:MAG: hypothetical protein AB7F28_00290 [Candidatus Margulisiibacteriota bacterium]